MRDSNPRPLVPTSRRICRVRRWPSARRGIQTEVGLDGPFSDHVGDPVGTVGADVGEGPGGSDNASACSRSSRSWTLKLRWSSPNAIFVETILFGGHRPQAHQQVAKTTPPKGSCRLRRPWGHPKVATPLPRRSPGGWCRTRGCARGSSPSAGDGEYHRLRSELLAAVTSMLLSYSLPHTSQRAMRRLAESTPTEAAT